ncbi:MAG: 50S ribosomal protein L23 [Candidatus Marinimicrobia bacterium]|nr:50S ribosomal protein L23 [Candidatus Neomarinimicrobiota bacterium]
MVKDRIILVRPITTEKMHRLEESQRKYAFQVDPKANKIEIKGAVERKFDVKVKKVSTINMKGKRKGLTIRSGGRPIRTVGKRADWKKAIVTLEPGFSIDLFGAEVTS